MKLEVKKLRQTVFVSPNCSDLTAQIILIVKGRFSLPFIFPGTAKLNVVLSNARRFIDVIYTFIAVTAEVCNTDNIHQRVYLNL
jgi:hypothetical protein